jgi:hypothetical protein
VTARFEPCQFGDRVATCYHTPRCSRTPGGAFGRWVDDDPAAIFCAVEADGVTVHHHLTIEQAEADGPGPALVVVRCPVHDTPGRPELTGW